ncbi:cytochrome P450 [Mycena sp. CBHHK59/15]|nr:cytochrome P450 [Mycena sp. CBHHK59/15]
MSGITRMKFGAVDAGFIFVSLSVCYIIVRRFVLRSRTTRLKGPSTNNFLFGMMPVLMDAHDAGAVYEEWAHAYGPVFAVPSFLGGRRIVIADPKAIAHFFSKETYGYIQTPPSKRFLEKMIGRGLFWAEGDSHKRQRRQLNPAFSNNSIKALTPIFFDSAYKAKAAWDAKLESSPSQEVIIDVQQWMNYISLDTIGLAGFSHDFGALSGKKSYVAEAFDSVGVKSSAFGSAVFLLSFILPVFEKVPTVRRAMLAKLHETLQGLSDSFVARTKREKAEGNVSNGDKSVIGLLAKSASAERISEEEVKAQINVLLLAGYETTAISLTWALIELSRHPEIQTKLRDEIFRAGGDPSWDELTSSMPYLDAVTCELLRMYPPLKESQRIAVEDDLLPLSAPIETAAGTRVEAVFVGKGTVVTLPIQAMNRSVAFWGPTAKTFDPERWLNASKGADAHRAQEIQGYRHLLTFSDGARTCLGKGFALAEFKAVLTVLVRNFTFEFPKGPETVIGKHINILPRPKVDGEDGYRVPLRIRHFVAE